METGETVYAFRSEGVIKIIRRLDAAARMARALEHVLPALVGAGDLAQAEEEALRGPGDLGGSQQGLGIAD